MWSCNAGGVLPNLQRSNNTSFPPNPFLADAKGDQPTQDTMRVAGPGMLLVQPAPRLRSCSGGTPGAKRGQVDPSQLSRISPWKQHMPTFLVFSGRIQQRSAPKSFELLHHVKPIIFGLTEPRYLWHCQYPKALSRNYSVSGCDWAGRFLGAHAADAPAHRVQRTPGCTCRRAARATARTCLTTQISSVTSGHEP